MWSVMPSKARKRGKKSPYETPFIVQVFEKHIKDWKQGGGLVYAKPKKGVFNHLIFQRKAFLFETKWYIAALYEAVTGENMNAALEALYRRLKGMECSLEAKGFLRRNTFFKESEFLNELRLYIPDIAISDELAKSLNEDGEVMRLLKAIRPDELTVSLQSMPAEYQPFVGSKEAVIQGMVEFYKKPTNILWVISLGRMLSRSFGLQKMGDNIIQLLEEIAGVINRKMEALKPTLDMSSQANQNAEQSVN